jgi:hypothetical protein
VESSEEKAATYVVRICVRIATSNGPNVLESRTGAPQANGSERGHDGDDGVVGQWDVRGLEMGARLFCRR